VGEVSLTGEGTPEALMLALSTLVVGASEVVGTVRT